MKDNYDEKNCLKTKLKGYSYLLTSGLEDGNEPTTVIREVDTHVHLSLNF